MDTETTLAESIRALELIGKNDNLDPLVRIDAYITLAQTVDSVTPKHSVYLKTAQKIIAEEN